MAINYICEGCKSDDIYWDATATWNVETQDWEVETIWSRDPPVCNECGAENEVLEVTV